jgi:hypothetical protein
MNREEIKTAIGAAEKMPGRRMSGLGFLNIPPPRLPPANLLGEVAVSYSSSHHRPVVMLVLGTPLQSYVHIRLTGTLHSL